MSIEMFVIYKQPSDFPNDFVVRRFTALLGGGESSICPDDRPLAVAPTLTEARRAIPLGRCRLPRDPTDEPQILEVWILGWRPDLLEAIEEVTGSAVDGTVHALRAGRSLCDMPGVPAEWPVGHRWVSWIEHPDAVTCSTCRARMEP